MSKKPTVLLIMDGFGLNDRHEANAVYEANTPNIDKLMAAMLPVPFSKRLSPGETFMRERSFESNIR